MNLFDSLLTVLFEQVFAPIWAVFDFVFGHLSLSILAILLGLGVCLPQVYGLKKPKTFAAVARAFPRSLRTGLVLMSLAVLWFLYNLRAENLTDFADFKQSMMFLFLGLGIGACLFLRDFLAVRASAILLLLLAKLTLDSARWHDSAWRLGLVSWAYIWVLAGMWLTISPWRLRDYIEWRTANDRRIRVGCGVWLLIGMSVVALGFSASPVQAIGLP